MVGNAGRIWKVSNEELVINGIDIVGTSGNNDGCDKRVGNLENFSFKDLSKLNILLNMGNTFCVICQWQSERKKQQDIFEIAKKNGYVLMSESRRLI